MSLPWKNEYPMAWDKFHMHFRWKTNIPWHGIHPTCNFDRPGGGGAARRTPEIFRSFKVEMLKQLKSWKAEMLKTWKMWKAEELKVDTLRLSRILFVIGFNLSTFELFLIFQPFSFLTCATLQLFNFSPPPCKDIDSKLKFEKLKSWKVEKLEVDIMKMLNSWKVENWKKMTCWTVESWRKLKCWKVDTSIYHQTLKVESWNLKKWEGSKFSIFQVFSCSFKVENRNLENWTFQHVQLLNFSIVHTPP